VKCFISVDHGIGNESLVESGQLAIMDASKRQEVAISDVSRVYCSVTGTWGGRENCDDLWSCGAG